MQFPNDVTQTERLLADHDAARRELKRDLETVCMVLCTVSVMQVVGGSLVQ